MELLAPCKNFATLQTAIRCGADSVYFGTQHFNARRKSENFTEDMLCPAVAYCHAHHVKAYLTLNTLIFDTELKTAAALLQKAADAHFDAVIVQDTAIVNLIRQMQLPLPFHASTQMSAHCVHDVLALEELGFSRIILARELNKHEIAYIRQHTHAELEVFVHGALCVSVSGQCYFSASLGPRSANRGLCAGVCRLPFGHKTPKEYALSLKDLCLIDHLHTLEKIGIDCIKIEGRMRDNAYVQNTVKAYRSAMNRQPYDKTLLRRTFSRQGFTDGYFQGHLDAAMFGIRTAEDKAMHKDLPQEQTHTPSLIPLPKIPVKFQLILQKDTKISAFAKDDNGAQVYMQINRIPCAALTKPTTKENVIQSFLKTGQTPYSTTPSQISLTLQDNLHVNLATLNALRRDLLSRLQSVHKQETTRPLSSITLPAKLSPSPANNTPHPASMLCLRTRTQIPWNALDTIKIITLPPEEILKMTPSQQKHLQTILSCEIPRIDFSRTLTDTHHLRDITHCGITTFMAHTPGAIKAAKDAGATTIIGGYGLNITNALAMQFYHTLGLRSAFLGLDAPVNTLTYDGGIERILFAYGRTPLMTLRTCPLKRKNESCKTCTSSPALLDRKGARFPLYCDHQQIRFLLNSVPTCVPFTPRLQQLFSLFAFVFWQEDAAAITQVLRQFYTKQDNPPPFTRGINLKSIQ